MKVAKARISNDDVIALAGICQAVALVQQAARSGTVEAPAFEASIGSIFLADADDTESIFGGTRGLKRGLITLKRQLGRGDGHPDPELAGYTATLMLLERKLVRRPAMMRSLREGIDAAGRRSADASEDGTSELASLAWVYRQTISRLSPRIMVNGVPEHLKNAETANRIRALLLAGMRATVLWRQVGGSRLGLLFGRRRMAAAAETALSAIGP